MNVDDETMSEWGTVRQSTGGYHYGNNLEAPVLLSIYTFGRCGSRTYKPYSVYAACVVFISMPYAIFFYNFFFSTFVHDNEKSMVTKSNFVLNGVLCRRVNRWLRRTASDHRVFFRCRVLRLGQYCRVSQIWTQSDILM